MINQKLKGLRSIAEFLGMPPEAMLLADAEGGEDAAEDIVGGGLAGKAV